MSALLDLHKAYEYVTHSWLIEQAVQHSFNWKILRFLIMLYSMTRPVIVGGLATERVGASAPLWQAAALPRPCCGWRSSASWIA